MNMHPHNLNGRDIFYSVIWCLGYFASVYALKSLALPTEADIAITAITILAFTSFIYRQYRNVFFADELRIKVQIEATVIAFSLGLLLLLGLGVLNFMVVLSTKDWDYQYLIPLFMVFYFVGLFISKHKYKFDDKQQG